MMREVSLIEYLPLFIQEYHEMRKIMTAENPEFQFLWELNGQLRDNLFILTAGEIGVKRWEKLLGIFPLPYETLDERKATILLRINEQLPYTMRMLRNMLEVVCGEGNFEINLDANAYSLKIQLAIFSNTVADNVASLLKRIIPVNLIFIVANDTVQLAELYYIGAMLQSMTHNLRTSVDLAFTFDNAESSGEYHVLTAALHSARHESNISVDLSVTFDGVEVSANAYVGSGQILTFQHHKSRGSVSLSETLDINQSGQLHTPMNNVITAHITQQANISI